MADRRALRAELDAAWRLFRAGAREQALERLMALLDHPRADDPEYAPVWGAAAAFAQSLGRRREARAWAERALALDEGEASAHGALGTVALDEGRPKEAVGHLRRAYGAHPTAYRAAELARALRRAGEPRQALSVAREGLERWPDEPGLLRQAAQAAEGAGDLEAAQRYWEALVNDPRQRAFARARLLRLRTGGLDPATAAQQLEQVARLRGEAERPELLAEAARRLEEADRPQEAVARLAQALAARPGDPHLTRLYAFALRQTGQRDQARPTLEGLLRQDPGDRYVRSALLADFLQDAPAEGLEFFTELVREHPEHPELYGAIRRLRRALAPAPAKDAAAPRRRRRAKEGDA